MKSSSKVVMLILLIVATLTRANRDEFDSSSDIEYDVDACLSVGQYTNMSLLNTLNITDGFQIHFVDIKDELKKLADDVNSTNTLINENIEKILENQNQTNVTLDGLATKMDVDNLNTSIIYTIMNFTTGPEQILNMLNETSNNVLEKIKEHLDFYNIAMSEDLSNIINQTFEKFNALNETLDTLALKSATDDIITAISNLTTKHDMLLDLLNETSSQENQLSSIMTEHEDEMQALLNSTKTELLNCCNNTSVELLERLQGLSEELQPKLEGLVDKTDVETLNDMLVQLTNKSSVNQQQGEEVMNSDTINNFTQLIDEKFNTLFEQLQDNFTELAESTKIHISNVTCELRQGQEEDLSTKLDNLEDKFLNNTEQVLEKMESLLKCNETNNIIEPIESLMENEEICLTKNASNTSDIDVQSIVDELKQHLTQLVCKPDIDNITNLIKSLATKEFIESSAETLDPQSTEETMENTTPNINSQSIEETTEDTAPNADPQSTEEPTENPTTISNSQSTEEPIDSTTPISNLKTTEDTTKSTPNSNSQLIEETIENTSNSKLQSTDKTMENTTPNSYTQSTEQTIKNPSINTDIKQDLKELREQINSLKEIIENKLSIDSLKEELAKMEERLQTHFKKIIQSEKESNIAENEKTIPEGENLVLTTPASTTMQPVECEQPFSNHGEGCYLFIHATKKSYTHANALCRKYGGVLASPLRMAGLQDYLQLNYTESFWVGGRYDARKGWHWPDGRPVPHDGWVKGSPKKLKTKRCVFMDARNNYKLNNMHCNEKYKFICSPKY